MMGFPALGPWVMNSLPDSSRDSHDQPYPAGAEQADTGVDKCFFEFVEGAELAVDGLAEVAFGFVLGVGREGEEVEDMVPCLRSVVE